jgi:uncharacterized phage protein gp47/JayE
MAYIKPTLSELTTKCRQYFNTHLPNVDSFLFPSFVFVLCKVFALIVYPLYIFLDYYLKQTFVHLADDDNLIKHGVERGLSKNLPTKAKGFVTVISSAGQVINTGSFVSRSDGLRYEFDTSTTTTGTDILPITAEFTGSSYNSVAGLTLNLAVSNPLITSITVTSNALTGGSDTESTERFRKRVLENIRSLRISGTRETVTNQIKNGKNGVTRVFFDYPTSIAYQVYFLMDGTYPDGLPLAGDVAEVQAIIDDIEVGLNPIAIAPTLQAIDINVNVSVAFTEAQKNATILELEDYLTLESTLSTSTKPFSVSKEGLDQAIARGLGTASFTMASPTANVLIATGKLPKLGNLTLVAV